MAGCRRKRTGAQRDLTGNFIKGLNCGAQSWWQNYTKVTSVAISRFCSVLLHVGNILGGFAPHGWQDSCQQLLELHRPYPQSTRRVRVLVWAPSEADPETRM